MDPLPPTDPFLHAYSTYTLNISHQQQVDAARRSGIVGYNTNRTCERVYSSTLANVLDAQCDIQLAYQDTAFQSEYRPRDVVNQTVGRLGGRPYPRASQY